MALDLFCYCSQEPSEARELHHAVAEVLRERYGEGFFVYEIRGVEDDHREIAGEFGLVASSRFLISVGDKEGLASQLKDVVAVLKAEFGSKNILVLLNNESPME